MEKEIIGIIGGLGPASTVTYYNDIIEKYRQLNGEEEYPVLVIKSLNMSQVLKYIKLEKYDLLINLLLENIKQLKNAGVTIGAIASNTPHVVFDKLEEKSSIPLISIVKSTVNVAKSKNYKKVLLTGTIFTMNNDFYQKEFEKENMECIVPNDEDKEVIQNIIFPNLENGNIILEDKLKFKDIVEKIIQEENVDAVILGCTELPLLIKSNDLSKPVLDTTQIHIENIINRISDL
jgi:aspartate racemase